MSLNQFFHLIYYSHLPLVGSAMILSISISAVLFQPIEWQVVFLIGLATYLTYSVDNLLDWNKEKDQYHNITTHIEFYHKLSYMLIPLSSVIIFMLIRESSNIFQVSTGLLGAAAAMMTARLPFYRVITSNPHSSVRHFLINRFFVSAVWTAVVVFLPIFYSNQPITIRIWRTYFYIFGIILMYATLWKLEKVEIDLQNQVRSTSLIYGFSFLTLISMSIVVIDSLTGLAPAYGLVNLLPPITFLVASITIVRNSKLSWQKLSLLTLILLIITGISATIHLMMA